MAFKKSDLFYVAARTFQNDRNAREDQFEKDMKSIEQYAGSKGYEERAEQFRKQRDADLLDMRAAARRELSAILEKMRENAGKTPVVMPTTEQVNLITILNMREEISQRDIDSAAEAVKNCPAALKMLDEIAAKKSKKAHNPLVGVSSRFAPAMSYERAMELLDESTISDFLQHNSSRAARLAVAHNKRQYGVEEHPARRTPFYDKEECFGELFGIEGDAYKQFCDMVDAD